MRDLEYGIHEFRTRAFLEVELLVETLAVLEVVAEVLVVKVAVVLTVVHSAALAAVACAIVLVAVVVFAAAGAIHVSVSAAIAIAIPAAIVLIMRRRANGLLGAAGGAEAAFCKAEGANGEPERASENDYAC